MSAIRRRVPRPAVSDAPAPSPPPHRTSGLLPYAIDDGGREDAGYSIRYEHGDCLVRAMAIASGRPYKDTYAHVALTYQAFGYKRTGDASRMGKKSKRGQPRPKTVQEIALRDAGFTKVPNAPTGPRPTYTEVAAKYGTAVVTTAKHFAAIRDGVLRDTFDGRTYEWDGEERERKAASIWLPPVSD